MCQEPSPGVCQEPDQIQEPSDQIQDPGGRELIAPGRRFAGVVDVAQHGVQGRGLIL